MLFRLQTHSHMPDASLQAFRSLVSDNLQWVLESLKLGSESLSLTWIHRCFRMIPVFHNAFAKLMVAMDYPISTWEAASIDEYLDYTINLLEVLNSITCSLSHLNQHRLSLSHALTSPVHLMRMRQIKPHASIKEFNFKASRGNAGTKGKEIIFHEAMLSLRSGGFWICGVVLAGLKTDARPVMEMVVLDDSWLMAVDAVLRRKMGEVEGVNLIVSGGNANAAAVKELKTRLELLGTGLKGLKEEEEGLFAKVMAARNQVLETLRRRNL